MSKRTVAEVLVDELAEAGVTRLYGLVGDSLNPVSDALRRDGRIRFIHVRHEETAAFAAGAEAQLSEKLAACAGTSGPGHVHLINGLYDANRSYAPVIAIASHIPGTVIGPHSNVYPTSCVRGMVPANSIWKTGGIIVAKK